MLHDRERADDEYLTFSDIERDYHISRRTIGRLVAEGELRAVQVRKRLRIGRKVVLDYLSRQPAQSLMRRAS